MRKEVMPGRHAFCMLVVFMFGSSVVVGVSSNAQQDAWVSLLAGAALFLPVALVYARIMRLYPEKDIFEIIETLFGKVIGKLVIVLICLYAIHLAALVIRDFSEFIQVVAMPETPQLLMMIAMLLVTVYLAKSGIEALGRWSVVAIILVLSVLVLTIVFSIEKMEFTNILPAMDNSFSKISEGAFQVFSFPFAETVLFLGLANTVSSKDSSYKLYVRAVLLGALVLMLVMLRNLFVLGPAMIATSYFPSYTTARIINVADFLSRIEGSISMNFILAGITKITLCLLAGAKGTARLFGINDYRQIVLPVGLITLALCAIVYKTTMELFDGLRYYPYYALPFQIAIPLIIWIAAEIKTRRNKAKKSPEKPSLA